MIAKAVFGKGFRGVLDYALAKGVILDTNMVGRSAEELANEFWAVRRLRSSLGRAVLHVSLSLPPGEHLSDEEWTRAVQLYRHGMGLEDVPYVVIRHFDTELQDVHVIASRVTYTGGVVADSFYWKRQEMVLRMIEKRFGLKSVRPSAETPRSALTKGEIEMALRTGEPTIKTRLQDLCDAAAIGCTSFTEYVERLEAVGWR